MIHLKTQRIDRINKDDVNLIIISPNVYLSFPNIIYKFDRNLKLLETFQVENLVCKIILETDITYYFGDSNKIISQNKLNYERFEIEINAKITPYFREFNNKLYVKVDNQIRVYNPTNPTIYEELPFEISNYPFEIYKSRIYLLTDDGVLILNQYHQPVDILPHRFADCFKIYTNYILIFSNEVSSWNLKGKHIHTTDFSNYDGTICCNLLDKYIVFLTNDGELKNIRLNDGKLSEPTQIEDQYNAIDFIIDYQDKIITVADEIILRNEQFKTLQVTELHIPDKVQYIFTLEENLILVTKIKMYVFGPLHQHHESKLPKYQKEKISNWNKIWQPIQIQKDISFLFKQELVKN